MPLRLEINRKLTARSDRVKSVDLHLTEPWMLASLYNGNIHVWNHETHQKVKSLEVCELPVRAAVFIPRKNWIVTGSDDNQIRVFNYNTLERQHAFEAHSDYIRSIAVHPTQPYILTSSDDMLIKLWNWEKAWTCQQVFEGHTHYVMQVVINSKDNNTFASASLDRTLKVWQLGSGTANFTLDGHEKGVNCVDYYHGGDKPYLISGADDRLVKIWDYQNKTCVQTLEGHAQNITAVCFHTELPIVITGSEDGSVMLWHSSTYRLENSLNYGLERVWTISCLKGSNDIAIGYDEGSVIVKIGREEPAISMDVNGEKIVWARHSEIQQVNLKTLNIEDQKDGERMAVVAKDMGPCDIFPQTIDHNPNGRFVVVCGDGEYIIYTAMALRNKSFGSAREFVWAQDSSDYAIREGTTTVRLFRSFKERKSFKPEFGADRMFGGHLLGISSASSLSLFDWETIELVRRIDILPDALYWSDSGTLLAIATEDAYYILKYNANACDPEKKTFDGYEEALEVLSEIGDAVGSAIWVGDCFIYTNSSGRLNYYVGGEIVTVAHLDTKLYLLGYVSRQNLLYLSDKHLNIVSYTLLLSVLEYQTAVMRSDFDLANKILPTIPMQHRTRVAHFLEKQGYKRQALAVSTDPEQKFELAIGLGDLELAKNLAEEMAAPAKWAQLAELATRSARLDLAEHCLHKAKHYPGLLLLTTATGNRDMLRKLGESAEADHVNNVSFLAFFLLGDLKKCLELLLQTDRIPEAAFFARTYLPSEVSRVVGLWKGGDDKCSSRLADPTQYPNLFPDFHESLKAEQFLAKFDSRPLPSSAYTKIVPNQERRPIEEMKEAEKLGKFTYIPMKPDGGDGDVSIPTAAEPVILSSARSKLVEEDDVDYIDFEIENMNLDDVDPNDLDEDLLID